METPRMPNGGPTDDQIKALWKALDKKQDADMCTVVHEGLKTEMSGLSTSFDKLEAALTRLTDKVEKLTETTWKIRFRIALLITGAGAGTGGLAALVFNLIEAASKSSGS